MKDKISNLLKYFELLFINTFNIKGSWCWAKKRMDEGYIVKSDDLGYKYSLRKETGKFPFDSAILSNETINVNPEKWDYLKYNDFLKSEKINNFYILDKFIEGEFYDFNHKLPRPKNLPKAPEPEK